MRKLCICSEFYHFSHCLSQKFSFSLWSFPTIPIIHLWGIYLWRRPIGRCLNQRKEMIKTERLVYWGMCKDLWFPISAIILLQISIFRNFTNDISASFACLCPNPLKHASFFRFPDMRVLQFSFSIKLDLMHFAIYCFTCWVKYRKDLR